MVFSVLKRADYERFTKQLIEKMLQEPLDPCFSVTIIINGIEYL